jgi:hypothetical protein
MKYALIVIVSFLFACTSKEQSQNKQDDWEILFDGKNLDAWRMYQNKPNNSWVIDDGVLHCKDFDNAQQRADLITKKQYENFEFHFEWKIPFQGNSGVMFRVSEELSQPYFSGPEFQLIDDSGYPGELSDWQKTGSNYAMHVASNAKINPAGEWNKGRLIVNGNLVEHWINDEKVLSYELGTEEWLNLKENSKWKDEAGYGAYTTGHISLQDHGQEVWFRNIKIKEL